MLLGSTSSSVEMSLERDAWVRVLEVQLRFLEELKVCGRCGHVRSGCVAAKLPASPETLSFGLCLALGERIRDSRKCVACGEWADPGLWYDGIGEEYRRTVSELLPERTVWERGTRLGLADHVRMKLLKDLDAPKGSNVLEFRLPKDGIVRIEVPESGVSSNGSRVAPDREREALAALLSEAKRYLRTLRICRLCNFDRSTTVASVRAQARNTNTAEALVGVYAAIVATVDCERCDERAPYEVQVSGSACLRKLVGVCGVAMVESVKK